MKAWWMIALIAIASCMPTHRGSMFDHHDLTRLSFLEGRWVGTAPNGSKFYEQYEFETPSLFRSRRYSDSSFSSASDGSTVSVENGEIVSQWGEYTWKASELEDGKACFVPMNAPSSFCWTRVSASTVHVTQNWKDADGKDQSYTVTLERAGS